MSKKKKKPEKSLNLGLKLLFILLLSCSLVAFGLFAGLTVVTPSSFAFALLSGFVAFVMLLILLNDYKNAKKEKTAKWYLDKLLAALVPVYVIAALTIIAWGNDNSEVTLTVGILMFPVISILISPNAAMYAFRDQKGWKRIIYGNGNLENFKDSKDFHSVKTPVSFENKILRAVIKGQILDILTVVSVLFVVATVYLISMVCHETSAVAQGNLIGAIINVRAEHKMGFMFFVLLFIVVFGFPVFIYYVSSAIYRIRIVTGHKYTAYHVIVQSIDDSVLRINRDKRQYKYKYSTLVGMREKQIHDTPATLIFIPDNVFVFPDTPEK